MKNRMILATTIPLSLMFFKGQIGVLKEAFELELLSSPGARLDAMGLEEDVLTHAIAMKREIALVADIKSFLKIIRLFRARKPAIVHGNTPKAGLLTMTAAYICRVPSRIYYLHGLRYEGASGFKRTLLMSLEKVSCLLATDVFSVSNGVLKTLKQDQICNKPINLIWNGSVNGINTSYFDAANVDASDQAEKYGIEADDTVFGFVGRLAGDKGINELVATFIKIHSENSKSKLLLVGMFEENLDPLKPETIRQIKEHDSIIHAGFQKDIRPFLSLMTIFTFPSYREGFGIALMEAQAMGIPVISTDITGCNEIIQEGYNGLLIQPKSRESLFNAMHKLINDTALTHKMAKVARAHVTKRYEQKRLWEETLKAYKQITADV